MRRLLFVCAAFASTVSAAPPLGGLPYSLIQRSGIRSFIAASAYDTNAQTYFTAVQTSGTTLDTPHKNAINIWYGCTKTAGAYTLLWRFGLLANQTSGAAAIDLVDPTKSVTPVNMTGADFTADRGWKGDGSSKYLNTGFDPTATAGFDSSFTMGSYTNDTGATSGNVDMGNLSSFNLWLQIWSFGTTGVASFGGNSASNYSTAISNGNGMRIIARNNTTLESSVNSTNTNVGTQAVGSVSGGAITVLQGSSQFSSRRFAVYLLGQYMTPTQRNGLYNCTLTLLTSLGAQ